MTCRRKTKKERELVADINKAFDNFCRKFVCSTCPYGKSNDCKLEYVIDLLKIKEEEDERGRL